MFEQLAVMHVVMKMMPPTKLSHRLLMRVLTVALQKRGEDEKGLAKHDVEEFHGKLFSTPSLNNDDEKLTQNQQQC